MKTTASSDRTALIRLAATLPVGSEERKVILAGLKKTARYSARDVANMDPDKAMSAADDIRTQAGRKAKEYLDSYRADAYEAHQETKALEKAWDKWDWDALEGFNVLTKDEASFVKEVLASYTW